MQDHKLDPSKFPPQNTFKKIQKSKNSDAKTFSIFTLATPYLGFSRLRLEHVVHTGPKDQARNRRYLGNGTGLVKRATNPDNGDWKQPDCAVKIMVDQQAAIREFQANILLGRESTWGTMNKKFYVLIPWIDGITLKNYCEQLKAHCVSSTPMTAHLYSIPRRIRMFIGYLEQVQKLHDQDLILGDPKNSNCMLDSKGHLILIDLDAVHRSGTSGWGRTKLYLPPNLINKESISKDYTAKDDIFILGHMLAELFPEFFNIQFDTHCRRAAELTLVESFRDKRQTDKNLYKLISVMMHEERFIRPLVDACINQLKMIEKYALSDFSPSIAKTKVERDLKAVTKKSVIPMREQKVKMADPPSKVIPVIPDLKINYNVLVDGYISMMENIMNMKLPHATKIMMLNQSCATWLGKVPDCSDQIQRIYIKSLHTLSPTAPPNHRYRLHEQPKGKNTSPPKQQDVRDSFLLNMT